LATSYGSESREAVRRTRQLDPKRTNTANGEDEQMAPPRQGETPPTTLAGARAAIAWLVEFDEPNIPETSGEYMRTLIGSPIFAQEEARS
jgi:hypothetical protein